jgi:hypothetical protein
MLDLVAHHSCTLQRHQLCPHYLLCDSTKELRRICTTTLRRQPLCSRSAFRTRRRNFFSAALSIFCCFAFFTLSSAAPPRNALCSALRSLLNNRFSLFVNPCGQSSCFVICSTWLATTRFCSSRSSGQFRKRNFATLRVLTSNSTWQRGLRLISLSFHASILHRNDVRFTGWSDLPIPFGFSGQDQLAICGIKHL